MRAEEQIEGLVEDRQVLVPVHEQRAERRAHVGTAANADPLDRLDGIDHPLTVDVHAGRAQHAAEEEQVVNQRRRGRVAWHRKTWRVRVAWHSVLRGTRPTLTLERGWC